jgi:hypothetical protein
MRVILAASLLVLSFAGCSQMQIFRVVDGQSRQPLDGIRGERLVGKIETSEIPLVLINAQTPVESRESDKTGALTFKQSGAHFMLNPNSKNALYGQAYVTATWSGATICYPEEHREISVPRVDGVVEIPLPTRLAAKPSSTTMR